MVSTKKGSNLVKSTFLSWKVSTFIVTLGLRSLFLNTVLLEGSHEGGLVRRSLEASVTEFGRGINELKVDLLKSGPLGVHQQRLEHNRKTY